MYMDLPPATAVAPLIGQEHWHVDDQYYWGVNGLTNEQRLWLEFDRECQLRELHAASKAQRDLPSLRREFDRLDQLSSLDR